MFISASLVSRKGHSIIKELVLKPLLPLSLLYCKKQTNMSYPYCKTAFPVYTAKPHFLSTLQNRFSCLHCKTALPVYNVKSTSCLYCKTVISPFLLSSPDVMTWIQSWNSKFTTGSSHAHTVTQKSLWGREVLPHSPFHFT